MNDNLRRLYGATPSEFSAQLVMACDALPAAANNANRLVLDNDPACRDLLERLAERLNGSARLAMQALDAFNRNAQPPNAA